MNRLLVKLNTVLILIMAVCTKMSTQQLIYNFDPTSYTVDEGVGTVSATIALTLSGMGTGSVSVGVNTVDMSATAPSDFIAKQNEWVEFGTYDGNGGPLTSKTVPVSIVDDTVFEGTECFNVTMANPSQGVVGNSSSAIICITNNDPPATAVSATNQSSASAAMPPATTASSGNASTPMGPTASSIPGSEASSTGVIVGVTVSVFVVIIVVCIIIFFMKTKSPRNQESYTKAKVDEEITAKIPAVKER